MNSKFQVTVTVKNVQIGTYTVEATSPFMAKQAATKLATAGRKITGELRFKVIAAR